MKKTMLITGGAGFIGINAANYFAQKNYNIIIVDNFSRIGSKQNLKWLLKTTKNKPIVVNADIRYDIKKIAKYLKKSDIVLHMAAQVAVTTSIKDPQTDFAINVGGTLNLLETIRRLKINPIFIYSSTNKVYGDLHSVPIFEKKDKYIFKNLPDGISEKQSLDFYSPYGCSKGAADQYVNDYHRIYGLKTIVFRKSCVYGPHQFGIEDQGWLAWFIIAAMQNRNITIYGNGKQVRDILYIDDLLDAYDKAIKSISITNGQIYNLGGGRKNSLSIWTELSPIMQNLMQKKIKVKFDKMRQGDQYIYISDIRKAKKDFNWSPKTDYKTGIQLLSNWILDNKELF